MNDSLKAVIIEVGGGDLRDHHIDLRGVFGLFPGDCLGGSDRSAAGHAVRLQLGSEMVETDIDEEKPSFTSAAPSLDSLKTSSSPKVTWC